MSLMPILTLPTEKLEEIKYPDPGENNRIIHLSRRMAAIVTIQDWPEMTHVVALRGGVDRQLGPSEDYAELIDQMYKKSYPMFTFPNTSLYSFWRKGQVASESQVDEDYGFRREEWLEHFPGSTTGDGVIREFTFFNAMLRSFGDTPDADHLEIRLPAQTYNAKRIPKETYERILAPSEDLSRVAEYASLWLPTLVMDGQANQWFGQLQAERDELKRQEEAERIKNLEEQQATQVIEEISKGFEDLGEAA